MARAVVATVLALTMGLGGKAPAAAQLEASGSPPGADLPGEGALPDGLGEARPLTRDARGRLVARWQASLDRWLEAVGAARHPLVADGLFGPLTHRATLEFQRQHPVLEADGTVEAQDWVALHDALRLAQQGDPLPAELTMGPVTSADHLSTGAAAPLVDVRASSHVGFDRVVFEFGGPGPVEYRVAYREPPLAPTGQAVDAAGTAVVEVQLAGPAPPGDPGSGRLAGPNTDGLQVIHSVAPAERSTEGRRWVLITRTTTPLSVRWLSDPARLVVDLATATSAVLSGPMSRCRNPAGFSLSHPGSWSSNDGDMVPACSQFHSQPFQVPASGERVAAIAAHVDDRPFAQVTAPYPFREEERSVLTIDGLPAVRLEHDSREVGYWPGGTRVTMYAVDLADVTGEPGTIIIDTIGIGGFDYELHQLALDRMVQTLRVDRNGGGPDADGGLLAG